MALDHDYLRYYTIKENDIILDLGATTGEFGIAFAPIIRSTNSKYIAVEPSLWNLRFLTEALEKHLHHHSLVLASAIFSKLGVVTLFESHANVLHTTSTKVEGWETIKYDRETTFPGKNDVIGIPLDLIIEIFGRINFIKCDIEGAELEAFMSSKLLDKVEAMAVAAYHIVDDRQTHEILIPFFNANGFETKLEDGIIYCRNTR